MKKKIIGNILIAVIVVSVVLIVALGVYQIISAVRYYSLTHVSGLPYENGRSSIDLFPYHVENPDNRLARLNRPSTFTVTDPADMPILDGAEAAYPVYAAFALNCYTGIETIQGDSEATHPIRFTNTIEAYKRLVSGKVDIFFGAQPSEEQKQLAKDRNKELKLTPIGLDAFVFFVSDKNPVDGMTSDEIRAIYSGRYTNWKSVGGGNVPILAFQRPNNSGSQTMMQYFMGDTPLKKPLEVEWSDGMGTVLKAVADYENKESAIGYSFRYYATQMENSYSDSIKFLSVDGVAPTAENIANGSYPLTTTLYAITLADNPKDTIQPFLDWMQNEQGRTIVQETGYVIAEGK